MLVQFFNLQGGRRKGLVNTPLIDSVELTSDIVQSSSAF